LTVAPEPPDASSADERGLVSVVIIFLNEQRFLRDAVESVRAQDYPAWELLLVDDGSTDASGAIAQAYAGQDARIRYLRHPGGANRGMSASRNLGLAHARGEYVAFLDADDVYLPSRLSRHVAVLEAHPRIAMCGSSYFRWFTDEPGTETAEQTSHPRPFVLEADTVWEPPTGLLMVTRLPFLHMGTCSLTIRRRVALEAGGFEASFRSMYEDQVFASKILARYPVYVLRERLARYRHHRASATRLAKAPAAAAAAAATAEADAMRFLTWLSAYVEEQGIRDPLLLETIRARREGVQRRPGRLARLRGRLGAGFKGVLERTLPASLHRRLLILDYELDGVRARRAYRRLTEALGQTAAPDATRTSQPQRSRRT
jgi:glycosyltransferase involved in cell wall biosynthesis